MAELDGAPVDLESLQRLALINFGHFTTLRAEAGKARGLSLHLDRLGRDCRALFGVDIDRDQVRTFIRRAVSANPAEVINLRVTVFDPALEAGQPGAPRKPSFPHHHPGRRTRQATDGVAPAALTAEYASKELDEI